MTLYRILNSSKGKLIPLLSFLLFILCPAILLANSEKVFAIDKHHCDSVSPSGGQNSFGRLSSYASGKGWKVKFIDVEPLTEKYLRSMQVSILCILNNGLPYTEEELDEIYKFVSNGGGLLVQAEPQSGQYMTNYSKEVLRKFGIKLLDEKMYSKLKVTIDSNHDLMKDVDVIYLTSGTMYLQLKTPAYSILKAGKNAPYRPVMAAAEIGQGRVVVFPYWFWHHLGTEDNVYFLRNALYWLQNK